MYKTASGFGLWEFNHRTFVQKATLRMRTTCLSMCDCGAKERPMRIESRGSQGGPWNLGFEHPDARDKADLTAPGDGCPVESIETNQTHCEPPACHDVSSIGTVVT